ncbi:MAG: GTPase Era [Candidatus Magasanikbacteria bacterium RIFCSPHIGHO2_01_FULL_41_23]|uniref:GTPase Era n=1 Tax=Candidatus Magasanikbacteria bacterium RIFCSPLOWO2_01_FULL_40_15 TaxID=1798686 RepID=A0A1F6N073_9BACT|nr:MAG: GTPase Era [Candidatus Magasanikbacteria bacterium RIFCSPHIGHO2_01_FULL_41_23]OGH74642.1 MAG: GTPase Era [Candidatus Magasanikbacteria bacterium RIFCSPHIGHO2_12_FULL_41_16]OGH77355.1 MAG: GTPase Era [Candidatus Magasanikbacteria bacterium RIFCSPLOWO2_01_FULL_40_15]
MKSGFAILIGRSNVGKSTLMNTLVGTKISATSFRAQMTRDIIHGVVNSPEGQAVFIDTPGIFKDKKSSLSGKLVNKAETAIEGVDVIIYVVDPTREIGPEERATFGIIRHLQIPKILVINKSDLPLDERKYQADYEAMGRDVSAVYSLSALRARHIEPLKEKIISLLPEGEPMYPEGQLTNVDNHFWVAELIREKVFSVLDKEVPYSITVKTESIEEKEGVMVISAKILTDEERYKRIIIGTRGARIKEIGQLARRELEQALGTKIFLELEVEVDKHWIERVE